MEELDFSSSVICENNLHYYISSPIALSRLNAEVEKIDIRIDSQLEVFQFHVKGKR